MITRLPELKELDVKQCTVLYQQVRRKDIANESCPRKGEISTCVMLYCWKERRTTWHPHLMKASHTNLQVTVVIRFSCSPLREWNIKGICKISNPWKLTKLIADHNFNQPQNLGQIIKVHLCNMGTSQSFELATPEVTSTKSLGRSGRIRQSP